MNLRWIENVRAAFVRVYGGGRGVTVCNAVIPGVMGDFRRMLERAAEGAPVTEQYRTDDRKTDICLEGHRVGDRLLITALSVGGVPVDLDGDSIAL